MPARYTWTTFPSPIGSLILAEVDGQPLVVEYALRAGRMRWVEDLRTRRPGAQIELGRCQTTVGLLQSYFQGRPRRFPFPGYLRDHMELTGAEEKVWSLLCDIPMGETRSYEELARVTGFHARQIGQLVGANKLAIVIPCHRVVGKRGGLVGYGGGLDRKRWLLDHEIRVSGVRLV
jgi:methylated-DNA-[protein]-cysteine S-methyltransferase